MNAWGLAIVIIGPYMVITCLGSITYYHYRYKNIDLRKLFGITAIPASLPILFLIFGIIIAYIYFYDDHSRYFKLENLSIIDILMSFLIIAFISFPYIGIPMVILSIEKKFKMIYGTKIFLLELFMIIVCVSILSALFACYNIYLGISPD
jgi:hypothetical protein